MGKIRLVGRLVGRDLRHRPGPAMLLVLALVAAAAGLAIGWLAGPLVASPGATLVGTPGAPAFTVSVVGAVVAVALVATLVPAIRGARTSTVIALADTARQPRRRAGLIARSARLPVPLLLALRLVARRPRRAVPSAASVAVTATGIVAVLAFHALSRALGASPGEVAAGMAAAQVFPAVPGTLLGIPLGVGLFGVAAQGTGVVVPPASWLAAAVLGILVAAAVLAAIPARAGARRPVSPVLQSDSA